MNHNQKNALINMLYAMRAQIDGVLFLLDEDADRCEHPKEQRISFTTMGGPEHWECKSCGFEYKEGDE